MAIFSISCSNAQQWNHQCHKLQQAHFGGARQVDNDSGNCGEGRVLALDVQLSAPALQVVKNKF